MAVKRSKILIIHGSTRAGRKGLVVSKWLFDLAQNRPNLDAELVDLRSWPLPFFNEPQSPSELKGNYSSSLAKSWAEKIGCADGFVFVTPEYNHGYSAVLKNALDYAYAEWNFKPAALVGYSSGAVAGARAVDQLRNVLSALRLWTLPGDLLVPRIGKIFDAQGRMTDEKLSARAEKTLIELGNIAVVMKDRR